jgi:hypothetical protein
MQLYLQKIYAHLKIQESLGERKYVLHSINSKILRILQWVTQELQIIITV